MKNILLTILFAFGFSTKINCQDSVFSKSQKYFDHNLAPLIGPILMFYAIHKQNKFNGDSYLENQRRQNKLSLVTNSADSTKVLTYSGKEEAEYENKLYWLKIYNSLNSCIIGGVGLGIWLYSLIKSDNQIVKNLLSFIKKMRLNY